MPAPAADTVFFLSREERRLPLFKTFPVIAAIKQEPALLVRFMNVSSKCILIIISTFCNSSLAVFRTAQRSHNKNETSQSLLTFSTFYHFPYC